MMTATSYTTAVMAIMASFCIIIFTSCSNSHTEIIQITGSNELTSITQALSDEYYIATEGRIQTSVTSSNADEAFKDLCLGRIHVAASSRPITVNEITQCSDSSIKVVEIPIASVPTVVVTHSMNKQYPKCLSNEEMKDLWNGTSDLGLTLYRPENNSDLSKYLDAQFGSNMENNSEELNNTSETIVVDLTNDTGGIGYLDYVTYSLVEDYLNPIGLQSSTEACSIPTPSKINKGKYDVLNRTLFLYFRHDLLKKNYLSGFAEMTINESSINIISNLGYNTLDSTVYAENRILLAERTAGSRYTEKNQNIGGAK